MTTFQIMKTRNKYSQSVVLCNYFLPGMEGGRTEMVGGRGGGFSQNRIEPRSDGVISRPETSVEIWFDCIKY